MSTAAATTRWAWDRRAPHAETRWWPERASFGSHSRKGAREAQPASAQKATGRPSGRMSMMTRPACPRRWLGAPDGDGATGLPPPQLFVPLSRAAPTRPLWEDVEATEPFGASAPVRRHRRGIRRSRTDHEPDVQWASLPASLRCSRSISV
jgi:hypothetical protein